MSEVGTLVKKHIKSSVLDSGELEILLREPKGNAWGWAAWIWAQRNGLG